MTDILVLDFMNQCHRARSGYTIGEWPVVYNYFRGLRAQVGQFSPNKVIVALEGHPIGRHDLMPSYKANRIIAKTDPKYNNMMKFFEQKDVIVDILQKYFPVSVVKHSTSEADDTIANIVSQFTEQTTVVSSDTDFIQLLQEHNHVKLFNPISKKFVEAPSEYCYITWKALRGDKTDNIPGIPGIGDVKAATLASNAELLSEYVSRPEVEQLFTRNYDLIRFSEWSDEERSEMTTSSPNRNWDDVKDIFDKMKFASITKDGTWQKFVETFDKLFDA